MRVLYAEDDDNLRKDFAEVLCHFFPDLLVAKDGVEAKKLYDTHSPSLIITDISMPLLDGLSLAGYIKKKDPYATVIITTGYNTTHHLTKAIDVHVDKFLTKPIDFQKLKDTIQELIPMIHQKYQKNPLKSSDDMLLRFFSHKLDIGICISDSKGRIVQYNRCLATMLGYDFQELKAKCFSILFNEEEREVVDILYSECFKTKTAQEMPIKWKALKKDGSLVHISLSASLIKTETKETVLLTTLQDISALVTIENIEHEQEMLLVKKRLEKEYTTRL
jgi:PAS domain S-box-containing protein